MTIKKEYSVGDTVWIYGIGPKNKITEGKVIKTIDLTDVGHTTGPYYIVEVPTHIDPLLEMRTWETISQDRQGPVGSLRELGEMFSTIKKVKTTGFSYEDHQDDEDNISPEQIHAALEKSTNISKHQPLVLKSKVRRRFSKKNQKHD
jgi:hypothetical protein